jgi:hypothetical protein
MWRFHVRSKLRLCAVLTLVWDQTPSWKVGRGSHLAPGGSTGIRERSRRRVKTRAGADGPAGTLLLAMIGLFAVIGKETSNSQKWVRWLRYQVVYILTIINGSTVLSAYLFHSVCEVIPGQRLARRWLLPSLRMLLFPREAVEISCSQQTVLCKCAAAATVEWSHLLLLSQRISFCKACALLNMSMTSFFHDIRVPSRVTN